MFDWDDVLVTEKGKDEHMGTPLYMSAQLLLGMDTRGLYDDLESLFYVVLHALSDHSRYAELQEQPVGFALYDNYSMGASRLTYTLSRVEILRYYGIDLDGAPCWQMGCQRRK